MSCTGWQSPVDGSVIVTLAPRETDRFLKLLAARFGKAREERKNRREYTVRHQREKETLDRKAIEQGEGF